MARTTQSCCKYATSESRCSLKKWAEGKMKLCHFDGREHRGAVTHHKEQQSSHLVICYQGVSCVRVFKRDLKENNEGVSEFLQEVFLSMKGNMEDWEVFTMLIKERYWRLLFWAGRKWESMSYWKITQKGYQNMSLKVRTNNVCLGLDRQGRAVERYKMKHTVKETD